MMRPGEDRTRGSIHASSIVFELGRGRDDLLVVRAAVRDAVERGE